MNWKHECQCDDCRKRKVERQERQLHQNAIDAAEDKANEEKLDALRASQAELLSAAKQAAKAVAELLSTLHEKHWHYDTQAALKAAIEKAEALNK